MDSLIDKLRAALDETERIALEASGPKAIWPMWETSQFFGYETPHVLIGIGSNRHPLSGGHFTATPVDKRFADHIVRHDPAAVLRQVAAHRKILELHEPDTHEVRAFVEQAKRKDPAVPYEPTGAVVYTGCPQCDGRDWDLERDETWNPCVTVLALAEAYDITIEEPVSPESGH